ncbi:ATP-binding protein [Xenorhabdus sp. KJ12.1]|uniref:ATP-binding protein n=1 Tax=Xenorhabdus sp. KJ12.1 TaxID=1851571 RepID=UPI000C0562D3|nr:ATP-binding protein [Xenorhabdus sp. KJ12.1]PHM72227.1 hypothetical protein Xekj_00505 [Xenorhabdus sp. KJ12.1]
MNVITKNVRIPDDLIIRLDAESLRSGRTRNAELVSLLEEAIIESKYSQGYSLADSDKIFGDKTISLTGGDSYQIRMPDSLKKAIMLNVPKLVNFEGKKLLSQDNFSEKVRYLLLRGLSSRDSVIPVELESIEGHVYHDKEIETKFSGLKMGDSGKLDLLLELGRNFENVMHSTEGHVLVYGAQGTGKSFAASYYKTTNPDLCHYLDLMPKGMRNLLPRRVILLWSNDKKYNKEKILVIDEAQVIDNDYLLFFYKKAKKKNVRLVLITQFPDNFEKSILNLISHKFDFNLEPSGKSIWMKKLE